MPVSPTTLTQLDSGGTNKLAIDASGRLTLIPTQSVEVLDSGGTNKLAIDASGRLTLVPNQVVELGDGTTPAQKLAIDSNGRLTLVPTQTVEILDSAGTNKLAIDASGRLTLVPNQVFELGDGTTPTQKLAIDASGRLTLVPNQVMEIGDGTTPTQKLAIDASGRLTLIPTQTVEILDSAGTNKLAIDASGRLTLVPTQTVEILDSAGTNKLAIDANGRLTLVPNSSVNMAQVNALTPLIETLSSLSGGFITEDIIRALTLTGKSYSATTTKLTAPGASTLGFQLFNPASSGKNILIYSLIFCNAAAGYNDIRMTTADVSTITGWTNAAITPVNNKGGGAASIATCGSSNTNLTGGLLGSARETTNGGANTAVETLSNGECILLPSSASINGIAIYLNLVGATAWSVTAEWLEF